MFYPTGMPLLTGLALFGAAAANAALPKLVAMRFGPGRDVPAARQGFGKTDVVMLVALGSILGLSVWFLVGRALGHIDRPIIARPGLVADPVVELSR
jgi:membrane protein DedA with SNARE-associated domain